MTLTQLILRHQMLPKNRQALQVIIQDIRRNMEGTTDPLFTGTIDGYNIREFMKNHGDERVTFVAPPRNSTLYIWIKSTEAA